MIAQTGGAWKSRLTFWLPVILPGLAYTLHSLIFRDWIIDDAGISYVYARNLAAGHGLVAQPGLPPVEGYSNFLWVILLAPFFALRWFDPYLVPKLLSVALVWLTFVWVYQALRPLPRGWGITLVALLLVALQPSFAIWTSSGLENALYVLVISGLFYYATRLLGDGHLADRYALLAGVLAAGIAMTRPDGVLYVVAYPALIGILFTLKRQDIKPYLRHLLFYGLSFSLLFGAFMLFRWLYFHDLLPNTYYAKYGAEHTALLGQSESEPTIYAKGTYLMRSIAGVAGNVVLVALMAASLYLAFARRYERSYLVVAVFVALPLAIFLLLPLDWMPEFRFATWFYIAFYIYLVLIMDAFIRRMNLAGRRRTVYVSLVTLIGIAGNLGFVIRRSIPFAHMDVVSFEGVAADNARRFNRYAQEFYLGDGSVLLADIGGALYYSELRVYDLAGLTDRTIARTLSKNQPEFYDYVFETLRPDFIRVKGAWAYLSRFDADPRFREWYVPICEDVDLWSQVKHNETVYAGIYVKASVAQAEPDALARLQAEVDTDCSLRNVMGQR